MAKTIIEELIGYVGLEIDDESFKKASSRMDDLKKSYERVAKNAKRLSVAAAAVAGFTVITNKLTAEQERMADSVGISTDALRAYGSIAKQAGLNTDNVVDLVEELNNKMGESKGLEELTAVTEATEILGLEFEALKKLSPEEQFFKVAEAAQNLGDAQAAQSAADILMGGEANKFIGLLRTQDKGLRELYQRQLDLNLLTKQGGKDAQQFNKTFADFTAIIGSAAKQLASLLGKGVEPIIKRFNDWVVNNKELSQTIISVFSYAIPIALGVAGVAVAALTIHMIGLGLALTGITWPILGIIAAVTAVAAVMGLWVNDIYMFIKHGENANTVIGAMIEWFKDMAAVVKIGLGSAFSYVSDRIDEAINKVKDIISWMSRLPHGAFKFIAESANSLGSAAMSAVGIGSPALAGGGGGTVNNNTSSTSNFQIDATGMDKNQLNQAIDERTGQQNATAANANSTGLER